MKEQSDVMGYRYKPSARTLDHLAITLATIAHALPTENLHLCNVTFGHAHKATFEP